MSWSPVLSESSNPSLRYLVQWLEVTSGVKKNVTVESSLHTVTELRKSTEYKICVATVYEGVITECSNEVAVQTKQGNKLKNFILVVITLLKKCVRKVGSLQMKGSKLIESGAIDNMGPFIHTVICFIHTQMVLTGMTVLLGIDVL